MLEDLVAPIRKRWADADGENLRKKYARMSENLRDRRSLSESLRRDDRLSFIFEIKRRSPALGELNAGIDAARVAQVYEKHHAAAISVLTEEKHFGGSLADLITVSEATGIPVLRKDFLVDELQLFETLAHGADAVLLMVKLLRENTGRYVELCRSMQIEPVVEIHDEEELAVALDSDAEIIGINNRDLSTLEIDLNTTVRLFPKIPPDRLTVSESGITSAREVDMMRMLGVDAVLIGTALSRAASLEAKLEELVECRRK